MFKVIQRLLSAVTVPILMLGLAQVGVASIPEATTPSPSSQQTKDLTERVQHSLLMLPYYGVFDELSFRVEGDTVTLMGHVRLPILKSDAEGSVRRIAGVAKVVNDIEVLPLSPIDDSLRLMTYRAIFSRAGFEKYGIQAINPIRIIVKNGNISLVGVVGSQFDKTMAGIAARNVPFAFSVTNNLIVG